MAMTDAERQARYRAKLRERAAAPIEAMGERERQAIFADWIDQMQHDNGPEAIASSVTLRHDRRAREKPSKIG
ncbi:hypothetical protein MKK68_19935 [Methylobacterium sp. E-016]|uniref:hypothetical protein n=1 Tax=Methylobacterium sp. E-016 TaxID=2836556 RepID=UPI001FBB1AC2|nr:hypothetical protein [Methylobacterium sp. E-016]MCJ2077885.1 hypothetical protein [Methylobacterium sp. E-016]